MAGESLVIRQRTFWRTAARPAPPAPRRVVACPTDRRTKGGTVRRARVRIRPTVRPEIAAIIRAARRPQARIRHVLDCYADPSRAGGGSLLGELFARAAAKGDPRMLRDALVEAVDCYLEIVRRIDVAVMPAPTVALPGTSEKVEVMAKRHELLKDVFHPKDARRE